MPCSSTTIYIARERNASGSVGSRRAGLCAARVRTCPSRHAVDSHAVGFGVISRGGTRNSPSVALLGCSAQTPEDHRFGNQIRSRAIQGAVAAALADLLVPRGKWYP